MMHNLRMTTNEDETPTGNAELLARLRAASDALATHDAARKALRDELVAAIAAASEAGVRPSVMEEHVKVWDRVQIGRIRRALGFTSPRRGGKPPTG